MQSGDFAADMEAIRQRARQHVEEGAVTQGYRANKQIVTKLLNDALATELICVLRYKSHYYAAKGLFAEPIAAEFKEHAGEEQEHADRIAERISQLGGDPDLNPDGLSKRAASEFKIGHDLMDMIKEDLIAERIAIDTYKQMIDYIGSDDPTTRRLLEDILEKEEEHAEDLANMIASLSRGS